MLRDGKNYSEFYAKNQITIVGCNLPGSGNGYYNIVPGQTLVWPPVLCKTQGTNWESGGVNTIRDYYDKDFLLKNRVYKKGIGTIHLSEYNWLNFFLTPQDKINMFVKGAQAAKDFLISFDWEAYKESRSTMSEKLMQELPKKLL